MPQFLALTFIGAGLYAGLRWVVRSMQEAAAELERARAAERAPADALRAKDLGTLVMDPASGVYHPARRG
jgi:hypothetical protein